MIFSIQIRVLKYYVLSTLWIWTWILSTSILWFNEIFLRVFGLWCSKLNERRKIRRELTNLYDYIQNDALKIHKIIVSQTSTAVNCEKLWMRMIFQTRKSNLTKRNESLNKKKKVKKKNISRSKNFVEWWFLTHHQWIKYVHSKIYFEDSVRTQHERFFETFVWNELLFSLFVEQWFHFRNQFS